MAKGVVAMLERNWRCFSETNQREAILIRHQVHLYLSFLVPLNLRRFTFGRTQTLEIKTNGARFREKQVTNSKKWFSVALWSWYSIGAQACDMVLLSKCHLSIMLERVIDANDPEGDLIFGRELAAKKTLVRSAAMGLATMTLTTDDDNDGQPFNVNQRKLLFCTGLSILSRNIKLRDEKSCEGTNATIDSKLDFGGIHGTQLVFVELNRCRRVGNQTALQKRAQPGGCASDELQRLDEIRNKNSEDTRLGVLGSRYFIVLRLGLVSQSWRPQHRGIIRWPVKHTYLSSEINDSGWKGVKPTEFFLVGNACTLLRPYLLSLVRQFSSSTMDALINSMTDTFSLIPNHGGTEELIPDGDQIEQLPSNEAQALKHAICISYRAISSYTRMQDGLIAVGSAQGTSPIAVVVNDDQRRAELLHHLVDKPPRFITSQALKKSTHARQNYECGAILVQHRHVVNLARVLEEDPKSVESTRHTFFLVVLIIHETGHYLRSILYPNDSLRRVSPPSLRPHAFLFSPHRSWRNPDLRDENQPWKSPFEEKRVSTSKK
ncbi:hypothetical protein BT96DRAFT_975052 [Gymnopus androsaceus JB14]|uniref:Uncharacterized protein n=1 Tax=Gymnopus androsaceus JB14 TaxID=1447944 RepID=A0A6A4HSW8_9AGAR|nr:hypothetical protein BT96DRAFT_975052 [Gymnopus androsaceus JB14]